MPMLYGFMNLKDVYGDRIDTVGVDVVNAAVDATIAEHNRQLAALLGLFVTPTTQYKIRYRTPVAARLQPLDENGRARPVKGIGAYDIAFPLQDAGIAFGSTFKASVKMTVEQANNNLATLLAADKRWVRDHILGALYANASYTYTDEMHGDLTIKGLANSDTDVYFIQAGTDAGTTDTHYLAQAAAIADATDPYPTIYTELTEHPENSGDIIALIPTNLVATTQALNSFYPAADPNLRVGTGVTTLAASLDSIGVSVPGSVIGYHDAKVWIVEWKSLPDNYIISVTTGGDRPLAMRQEPEAELQGFARRGQRNDYPFFEDQYSRTAGFGAYNRVGAAVTRIGNGAYAIPTNYTMPMP